MGGNMTSESDGTKSESSPDTQEKVAENKTETQDSSAPANAVESITKAIPYQRFQQVVGQKNEAKDEASSARAELDAIKAENSRLREELDNPSEASEGIKPFIPDIDKRVQRGTQSQTEQIQQLTGIVTDMQAREAERFILNEEADIRNNFSGQHGRRSYEQVLPEIQKLVEQDKNQIYNVKQLYLQLTATDMEKHIAGLEAKAGITKTERSIANGIEPNVQTQAGSIVKPKNYAEMLRQGAKKARESLQST